MPPSDTLPELLESLRSGADAPRKWRGMMTTLSAAVPSALIKVLNGAAAGREVALTKVVTTVGKPGVQVASITKRPTGYVIAHVEGVARPRINGVALASETAPLRSGDLIELAGTEMQFVQG